MKDINNKLEIDELVELIEKIEKEIAKSKERQEVIDTKNKQLDEETRIRMVQKGEEELKVLEEEKQEFDEMTKNALISAKKMILQIKEDSKKEYQEFLIENEKKKDNIKEKLSNMKKRLFEKDKIKEISVAEEKANNALEILSNEMKDFQENYTKLIEDLETKEKDILTYSEEIGVKEEILLVTLDDEKIKSEEPKPEEIKPEEIKSEETKPEEPQPEEIKSEEIKLEEPKPEEVIPEPQLEDVEFEDVYSYVGIDGILITPTTEGFVMAYAFKDSFEGKTDDEIDYEEAVKTMELSYADGDLEDDLNDGFDNNIERLLDELWNNSIISGDEYNSYIYGIEEGKKMPFWITYDLRDIYKTDLTNKEIKNLFKIAKQAKKINPDIKVKKDNILKRALGKVSKGFKSTVNKFKGLNSGKKQEMLSEAYVSESSSNKTERSSFVPTYSQQAQDIGKYINDSEDSKDLETRCIFREGEIEKLSDEEKEYIQNIITNKEKEFKDVVKTVHPDGRVETGRRIYSIEEDDEHPF